MDDIQYLIEAEVQGTYTWLNLDRFQGTKRIKVASLQSITVILATNF